jgi:hypothetical protein
MTRLVQCIVIGGLGTAVFIPAVLLFLGEQAGVAQLRHWGVALNSDASLVQMLGGGVLLYTGLAAQRMKSGNSLHLRMFKVCAFAAGLTLLTTNAYLIALRLVS